MTGREREAERGYRPTMSLETQQRIRECHERAYAEMTRTEPASLTNAVNVRIARCALLSFWPLWDW